MTFTSAAWGIDGALSPASLARLAARASVKQSGVINVGDLKVTQLSSPGNGVKILAGGAALENFYVSTSGQTYIVENIAEEILGPSTVNWPATAPGVARSHLVCVSIGDPQYSMVGHPWLNSGNAPANPTAALTYQYVRPVIIPNVPAGTTRVEDLVSPPAYPVYALARLDLSSGWTSIADAQIFDLRKVVNPREEIVQWNVNGPASHLLNTATDFVYVNWPNTTQKQVYIPKWATKIYCDGYIHHFIRGSGVATVDAPMRIGIDGGSKGVQQNYYSTTTADAGRYTTPLGCVITPTPGERGTIQTFQTEATYANHTSMANSISADARTNVMLRLRFVEEAV